MSHSPRALMAALLALVLLAGACTDADEPDAAPAPEDPATEESTPAAPEGPPTDSEVADDPEDADDDPTAADGSDDGDVTVTPSDTPVAFDDADDLATTLASAEAALAGGADDTDLADWAAVHQLAYRELAERPEWREQAREALPPELHDAYDLTLHAVEELLALTDPAEQLPDWRIEAPPPVDELRAHYDAAEAEFDVPWSVLAAIHLVETRFGRIHGDSSAGAQGPMQFMPDTWEQYGEGDVHAPHDAIMAAGRYLAASGAPDDLEAALFAYNRSDHYVKAVLAHAEAMEVHDHYLDVYHGWQVHYRTVDGDVLLEEGYDGS